MGRPRITIPNGSKFGELTVLNCQGALGNSIAYEVVCSCGNKKICTGTNLRSGATKSCGCKMGVRIHNMTHHPLYNVWAGMIDRCTKPHHKSYKDYGGRGITVCAEWMDIKNFIHDMGPRPFGYELDRIDNDQGYSKSNCKWSSERQNANNRRNTVMIEFEGAMQPISYVAERCSLPLEQLRARLKRGMKDPFQPLKRKKCQDQNVAQ